MKKKIEECTNNSSHLFLKMLSYNVDLSILYKELKPQNFGHLIAFYSLLKVFNEFRSINKEEKEIIIVQLTTESLSDFQRYKKKYLQERDRERERESILNFILPIGWNIFKWLVSV